MRITEETIYRITLAGDYNNKEDAREYCVRNGYQIVKSLRLSQECGPQTYRIVGERMYHVSEED